MSKAKKCSSLIRPQMSHRYHPSCLCPLQFMTPIPSLRTKLLSLSLKRMRLARSLPFIMHLNSIMSSNFRRRVCVPHPSLVPTRRLQGFSPRLLLLFLQLASQLSFRFTRSFGACLHIIHPVSQLSAHHFSSLHTSKTIVGFFRFFNDEGPYI